MSITFEPVKQVMVVSAARGLTPRVSIVVAVPPGLSGKPLAGEIASDRQHHAGAPATFCAVRNCGAHPIFGAHQ